MKRIHTTLRLSGLLLALAILLSVFAACANPSDSSVDPYDTEDRYDGTTDGEKKTSGSLITTIPEGLTGTDVAKLLLADQRLSTHLVNTEDDIFENGAETYLQLADMTRESIRTAKTQELTVRRSRELSSTIHTQIAEFCRSYELFRETANRIISNAESGAEMINYVKKYVRVVDAWVTGYGGSTDALYLHVEENSETVYQLSDSCLRICHRYKNERGQDVYELYEQYMKGIPIHAVRSTYISGERYELTTEMENGRYDTMVAENTKGYWEVFTNSSTVDEVNFPGEILHGPQFFVLKDDICYSFYHLYRYGGKQITLVNEARTADILAEEISDGRVSYTLYPGTFEGVESVTVQNDGGIGTVELKNGTVLSEGTAYREGALLNEPGRSDLLVSHIRAGETAWGVELVLGIDIHAESVSQARAILKRQLEAWGLTSKYGDPDKLFLELDRAAMESENMIRYHKWNGYSSADGENLTKAREVELARFAAMVAMYDAVKDAPKIPLTDKDVSELAIQLPKVEEAISTQAIFPDQTVTLANLELVIKDTLLLIEGEPYAVFFALKPVNGEGLVHVACEMQNTVAYAGEESFRVASGAVSFAIPTVAAGTYTLVAYIGTADGIRTSDHTPVVFDTVTAAQTRAEELLITYEKAEDGTLRATFEKGPDVYLYVEKTEALDYAALYERLGEALFQFGSPADAPIERMGEDGTYFALSGEETVIEEGHYRLGYTVFNGESSQSGYVYLTYGLKDPGLDEKAAEKGL